MSLTIHILIKNNEQTIRQTLQSIVALNADILIGDQGSTDKTLSICKEFGAKIVSVTSESHAAARNHLITTANTAWGFYLQPWEVLANGHRHLLDAIKEKKNSYLCQIFRGNMVSKEIRLWSSESSLLFENPIYETLYDPHASLIKEIVIYSRNTETSYQEQLEIIKKWKKDKPTSPNPYYYEACVLLQQSNFNNFITTANYYLFQEKQGISAAMLKYYLATVYCYHFKDQKSALYNILPCLAVRPLMAEFWCLLGDIFYNQNDFWRAKTFYENAIILGSQRKLTDEWPIEINKYKEYPQKMMKSCDKMKSSNQYATDTKIGHPIR